jgi:hypothetical protein
MSQSGRTFPVTALKRHLGQMAVRPPSTATTAPVI